MAQTILGRLIKSLDAELTQFALEAEERLDNLGIPLSNPEKSDWELWHSVEVKFRWSWREVCRRTAKETTTEHSIRCIQWLCTAEEGTQFQWL